MSFAYSRYINYKNCSLCMRLPELLSWIVLSQRTHVHSPILFLRVGFPSPTTEPWTHSEQQQPKAEHKEEEGRDSFQHTCRVIRSAYHSPSCLILPPSKTTSRVPAHSSCGHSACRPSPPLQVTSYTPRSGPLPVPFRQEQSTIRGVNGT